MLTKSLTYGVCSGFANAFNGVLDPLMIFKYGWGVSGAAIATVVSEFISAISYFVLLSKSGLVKISKLFALPSFTVLKPLLAGGAAVQLRAVALNIVFLAVTRATQTLDNTGTAAAAHAIAIQVFNVGGIFLLALSTVAVGPVCSLWLLALLLLPAHLVLSALQHRQYRAQDVEPFSSVHPNAVGSLSDPVRLEPNDAASSAAAAQCSCGGVLRRSFLRPALRLCWNA